VTPLATPLRVVFDARAELPTQSRLRRTAAEIPTLVLASPQAPAASIRALRAAGVHVDTGEDLGAALRVLGRRGVTSLLVEGGGSLAGRLLAAGLVDRLMLITAPMVLGADGVPAFGDLAGTELERTDRWRVVGRRTLGADALTVLDRP
jgi:diaminohydroxyphosphoribosylaminopyrimidine deaminase/5-amino-6-(5-phosphoribosylamino)uracil reductase